MQNFRIALAQVNPTVGDLEGNLRLVESHIAKARDAGASLVAFPEMVLTGYPPEDLLLKPAFIDGNIRALKKLVPATRGICAVVGFVDRRGDIFNAAALLHDGEWIATYHKNYLPNYGVFDEYRYFQHGEKILVCDYQGLHLGLSICEDIWQPTGPLSHQTVHGDVDLAINISASPFYTGRTAQREQMLSTRARDHTVALAYVNMVGGQDALVFDGNSLILNEKGQVIARGQPFRSDMVLANLNLRDVFRSRLLDPRLRLEKHSSHFDTRNIERIELRELPPSPANIPEKPIQNAPVRKLSDIEEIFEALVLGTRDYLQKNGFQKAVVGLSGGIDSSLTATLAVEAFGPRNVRGIIMPSRYSSDHSRTDAEALARNLGIEVFVVPIEPVRQAFEQTLTALFKGREPDVTEENIQARIRGTILMSLSNKFGCMVLTTGNKSETSVGYCTLYGDTAGGLSVIQDVPKMTVYALCEHINRIRGKEVIPRSVLEKAPSAELRPDQKDSDSLPPYEDLDPILHAYVEDELSLEEIVMLGYTRDRVKEVLGKVDRNEYKRRQGPPGLKITPKAFGRDRRLPITNRFVP